MKKEQDDASAAAPRMKFAPKIPIHKKSKSAATKTEKSEAIDALLDKELITKLNAAKSESSFARRPRAEKKGAPVQVAFGQGSSSVVRSFGNQRSAVTGSNYEDDVARAAAAIKEYDEPWDYVRTYYPVTLPLRRPYSGDPEILDHEEFGEDSMSGVNKLPPAEELGLMESIMEPQMFLFQFPAVLPMEKPRSAAGDGKESETKPESSDADNRGSGNRPNAVAAGSQRDNRQSAGAKINQKEGCALKDLPSGFLGKLLVYKSGKVKMKIGDALFDVSPGQNCVFAQDAAVINAKEKHCCVLGDLTKRVVVTPDVDTLLESIKNL